MEFKKDDLLHLDNLMKALNTAKYPDLKGDDIIAFYRMFVWVSQLGEDIKKEIETNEALASMKIVKKQELKSPIKNYKNTSKKKGKKK